jgi:hypothetical protein
LLKNICASPGIVAPLQALELHTPDQQLLYDDVDDGHANNSSTPDPPAQAPEAYGYIYVYVYIYVWMYGYIWIYIYIYRFVFTVAIQFRPAGPQ